MAARVTLQVGVSGIASQATSQLIASAPTLPYMMPPASMPLSCFSGLVLERNEVIALFNTLERLAAGVEVVRDLSLQLSRCVGGALEWGTVAVASLLNDLNQEGTKTATLAGHYCSNGKHPNGLGAIQEVAGPLPEKLRTT